MRIMRVQRTGYLGVICFLGCFMLVAKAFALLPFPYTANQRGLVTCLETPSVTYDVYLPPSYTTNTVLPILYTFNPSGGGMVSEFQSVCSDLNIIAVGILSFQNGTSHDNVLRDVHAVTRDLRLRVMFDPTAELASGFSGGGVASYIYSRFRAQHVAGVFAMSGWLGRTGGIYPSTDRVQTNLLVARNTGVDDAGAQYYLIPDSNYLASCGAVVKDWYMTGGHYIAPYARKSACLSWLVTNRRPGTAADRINALSLATNWQARLSAGQTELVLREAVTNLMTRPRSWFAYQSQLVLDQVLTNASFRSWNVTGLAQGDFASDQFYYYARGASLNGDTSRCYAAMKALTGIGGVSGDRAGGIYSLLCNAGYVAPILQCSPGLVSGQITLWLTKDTPGLNYSVQSCSHLAGGGWQDVSLPTMETNTLWSAAVDLPSGSDRTFFRMRTEPTISSDPPWP